MNSILGKVLTTFPEDFYTLWTSAAKNSHLPDPLSSEPEWCLSYHLTQGINRPLFLFGDHGNCLFLTEETMQGDRPVLTPLESSWMYDRPLLGTDPIGLMLKAVDELEAYYRPKNLPTILFGGMWPHQPLSNELLLNLGHLFNFYLHQSGRQCAASLEGGIDGFLSRRSSNFRAKLKKARRIAKDKGIYFERVSPTLKNYTQIYERMLKTEALSWKGKEKSGLLYPTSTTFYRQLLAAFAALNHARVIFARDEDQDIGFIFGGLSNNIYRGQQFSFSEAYKKYSIGNILQYEKIAWLCEDKIGRYDMGPISGPKMEYKAHWTELVFPLQSWILYPKSVPKDQLI